MNSLKQSIISEQKQKINSQKVLNEAQNVKSTDLLRQIKDSNFKVEQLQKQIDELKNKEINLKEFENKLIIYIFFFVNNFICLIPAATESLSVKDT